MIFYRLTLLLLFTTLAQAETSLETDYQTLLVQEFPLDISFYNEVQEDFFDLVYLYPYKKKFLSTKEINQKGFYAFRYKKDGSLTKIEDKDLLIFLARNNLSTPKNKPALKRDYLVNWVVLFLLIIILISIFRLIKKKRGLFKKKITGYLRGKKADRLF